jgi:hypothetical protein
LRYRRLDYLTIAAAERFLQIPTEAESGRHRVAPAAKAGAVSLLVCGGGTSLGGLLRLPVLAPRLSLACAANHRAGRGCGSRPVLPVFLLGVIREPGIALVLLTTHFSTNSTGSSADCSAPYPAATPPLTRWGGGLGRRRLRGDRLTIGHVSLHLSGILSLLRLNDGLLCVHTWGHAHQCSDQPNCHHGISNSHLVTPIAEIMN